MPHNLMATDRNPLDTVAALAGDLDAADFHAVLID